MKQNVPLIFLLFQLLFVSCISHKHDIKQSRELNNVATDIFFHNYSNVDSLELALKVLDQAIDADDTNFTPYTNKLSLLLSLGRCEEALRLVDKILTFGRMTQLYLLTKGNILENLGKVDRANILYKEVLSQYDSLIKKSPNNVKLKLDRCYALLFTSGYTTASNELDYVKKQYPNNTNSAYYNEILKDFDRNKFINSICKCN